MLKSRSYCSKKSGASIPLLGLPVLISWFCCDEHKYQAGVHILLKICADFPQKCIAVNKNEANVLDYIYWKQVNLSLFFF